MSEVETVVETEVEAVDSVEQVEQSKPDIDLSAVPEKHREYVDVDKYQADADYKRAIEHGWKPREAFEAEGLDDADWTGYRQFNRRYDDRQSIKAIKEGQDALLKTFEQQKQEAARIAVEQALAAKQEELKIAASDGDVDRALKIQREMLETAQKAPKAQDVPEPLPVVDFRRRNAVINPQSEEFDASLNREFEQICLSQAERYSKTYGRQLSDLEVKIILESAYDMIKDKAKKPAVSMQQKAPAVSKPAQKQAGAVDYKKALPKEWQDTYNRLLTAKGGGKDAADAFAKEVMGGVK